MAVAMMVQGNALHLPLADNSVQCCVTSPPYYGLRDYGTATWEGGDPECDHKQGRNGSGRADGIVDDRGQRNRDGVGALTSGVCAKCGARRIDAQLGLEPTPEEYVANMVAVFREVRRLLTDDGTLWLNLGDSYASGNKSTLEQSGLKPKDLIGIPWRVAFALQADGWWLRSDIIWHKPNPMPESVRDRPTKAHEYVFLLTKSARYYYDADAVAELRTSDRNTCGQNSRANVDRDVRHGTRKQDAIGEATYVGFNDRWKDNPTITRNRRDVWSITTKPYSGAHFATMPPELAETCIKAGSASGDVVLDPFSGAGATAVAAIGLGRNAIGIELSAEYIRLAEERLAQTQPALEGLL